MCLDNISASAKEEVVGHCALTDPQIQQSCHGKAPGLGDGMNRSFGIRWPSSEGRDEACRIQPHGLDSLQGLHAPKRPKCWCCAQMFPESPWGANLRAAHCNAPTLDSFALAPLANSNPKCRSAKRLCLGSFHSLLLTTGTL